MDNSQLEKEAESLISSKLQKGGILIAKPSFDIQGSDLLAFVHLNDGARFCRVQCKGRSVESSDSSVSIPASYVTESFILFLYLKDGTFDNEHLYCFFYEEICSSWKLSQSKSEYKINIPRISFDKKFRKFQITYDRMKLVAERISSSDINEEFSRFFEGGIGRNIVGEYLKLEAAFLKLIGKLSNVTDVRLVNKAPFDILSIDDFGNKTAYRLLVYKDPFGMMSDIGTTLEEFDKYCDENDVLSLIVVLFFQQPKYCIAERLFQAQYSRRFKPFYIWQYGVEMEDVATQNVSFDKRAEFSIDISYWDSERAKKHDLEYANKWRNSREMETQVLSNNVDSTSKK